MKSRWADLFISYPVWHGSYDKKKLFVLLILINIAEQFWTEIKFDIQTKIIMDHKVFKNVCFIVKGEINQQNLW